MKLFQVEYTWDDMPHTDIIPLVEASKTAAVEWLEEHVGSGGDDFFEVDGMNEVTDMVDSDGNGSIEAYHLLDIALQHVADLEHVPYRTLRRATMEALVPAISDLKGSV